MALGDPVMLVGGPANTTSGFSLEKLLANENFLNMLAGIGAGLDPNGAGGAIGNALIAYNKSKVVERNLVNQSQAARAWDQKLIDQNGGLNPSTMQGVRSFKVNEDGSRTLIIDPPQSLNQTIPPTSAGQVSGSGQNSNPSSQINIPSQTNAIYGGGNPRQNVNPRLSDFGPFY